MRSFDTSAACATSPLRGCVIASRALVFLTCAAAIGLELFFTAQVMESVEGMKLSLPALTMVWFRLAHMHLAVVLFGGYLAVRALYRPKVCCLTELKFNLWVSSVVAISICIVVGGFICYVQCMDAHPTQMGG